MSIAIYSGPGKVVATLNGAKYAFQAEGENGQVKLSTVEKRTVRQTASLGYQRSTLDDQVAELTFTPFDQWSLLPALFPAYLGVTTLTTGGATGALNIGQRSHDYAGGNVINGKTTAQVWTNDGRLYTLHRAAITQHPNLKLGVGQPLYGQSKITGLWAIGQIPGDGTAATNFLSVDNDPQAPGGAAATDPDTVGFTPDFVNGHWTASWNADSNFASMEVEDFWTVSVNAKYSPLRVQKLTRHFKLDSVEFMVKGRITGPTHGELLAYIGAHQFGANIAGTNFGDLTLTGPGPKTITLHNAEVMLDNQGFEFGGTKLGTGEVAFVTTLDYNAGPPATPKPVLKFSA